MELLKVAILFAVTAVAEIVGCYLPWLVVKQGKSAWLLLPAAVSLSVIPGPITAISESGAAPPVPYAERAALDAATPIVPGKQDTTATISVTFFLR